MWLTTELLVSSQKARSLLLINWKFLFFFFDIIQKTFMDTKLQLADISANQNKQSNGNTKLKIQLK